MSEWKKVSQSGDTIDIFEVKHFVGIYDSMQTNVGPNNSNMYNFKDKDGKIVSIWATTVLNTQMAKVPVGYAVMIDYLGKERNPETKREFHNFEVQSKEVDGTEFDGVETAPKKAASTKTDEDEDLPF